jgi:heat shock protein HtpX
VVLEYFQGARQLLRVSGAAEPNRLDDVHLELLRVTENLAITAGLPTPSVRVIAVPYANAFSVGRKQSDATIVVTQGLLDVLSRTEIEGVIAHEIAHIQHSDTQVSTFVAALGTLGGRVAADLSGDGRGPTSSSSVLSQSLAVLTRLICGAFRFAISRDRELLADAAAVQLTRYPEGLANALLVLSEHQGGERGDEAGTQHLWILPASGSVEESQRTTSHPSLTARISQLKAVGSTF